MLMRTCRVCNKFNLQGRHAQIGWICVSCDIQELHDPIRMLVGIPEFPKQVAEIFEMSDDAFNLLVEKEFK